MNDTQRFSLYSKKALCLTVGAFALNLALPFGAFAQVTVSTVETAPRDTATDGDITIDTAGGITLTDDTGPAITINSDNTVSSAGAITITDVDNATGILIDTSATSAGSLVNGGSILINESFTAIDSDGDGIQDGVFAEGSGRTGILISGASPFTGDVELASGSTVDIEGNDSYGFRLAENTTLDGNFTNTGGINVTGTNSIGVNIEGNVTGDVTNQGISAVSSLGQGVTAYNIAGDIQGGFVNAGTITNTGYRATSRFNTTFRDLLTEEDLLQAGPAINVSGNIGNGIAFRDIREPILDDEGNPTFDENGNALTTRVSVSSVTQNGGAPAVLIDAAGNPTNSGIVIGPFLNPDDPLGPQYAFLNQGQLSANGVFNDINATVLSVDNAVLTGGISNEFTMSATAFVGGTEDSAQTAAGNTGLARVIVLGPNAIAETINNSGIIAASVSEDGEEIYADLDNILTPRHLVATAIDIVASTDPLNPGVTDSITLTNSGSIVAVAIGRDGTVHAIQDATGRLISVDNTGTISALGANSTPQGLEPEETDFVLVAINASANTSGFTLTQSFSEDGSSEPAINGDILLGTGDDTVDVSFGTVTGDLAFNDGNDVLSLSGGAIYEGEITNTGGLAMSVAGSSLILTSPTALSLTSANFDGTSTFSPVINGSTASSINASGAITFEDGAVITPTLQNIVGIGEQNTFTLASAGTMLDVQNIAALAGLDSPFLYTSAFDTVGNTLVITLTRRDPNLPSAQGGLGLDSVQAAAFNGNIEAWSNNDELGAAFANIRDEQTFNRAYNQILPEFAAAARQFVIANVDGATGAVGSHLETTRRSPEKPGGAWIEEFAYFADRELAGLSEQYRGSGFGFTGGFDTALGPLHAVGVNIGFASTEIEDVVGLDDPLGITTLQAGLYAGWQSGNLSVDGYAGAGINDFEQRRNVDIGTFSGNARGDWKGTHFNGSLRAGYDLAISDKFWARPTVVVDYIRLKEDAYRESGTSGVALGVDSRTSETGSITGLMNVGTLMQGRRTWVRPSLRAGVRHEYLSDPTLTNYRFIDLVAANGDLFDSTNTSSLLSNDFPATGIIVGFSVAAGSDYSSIGFDVDSDIRDGFIRTTGRVVIRLLF